MAMELEGSVADGIGSDKVGGALKLKDELKFSFEIVAREQE
jgi:hypothetical protein